MPARIKLKPLSTKKQLNPVFAVIKRNPKYIK